MAVAPSELAIDTNPFFAIINSLTIFIKSSNFSISTRTDRFTTGFDCCFPFATVEVRFPIACFAVRMVPIESVVNRFPRMIRDLSKKLNKKMELYMTGEDTELDRTVIDEIGDPLMHLLRNAADHGLESNEERVRLGKPEVGSIFLDAYQEGNNVVIEVRDDGCGINVERVRNKAIERGTITEEQAEGMTDKEIVELLFRPSFSTSEVITDVSGRGVGLDVVKTSIQWT